MRVILDSNILFSALIKDSTIRKIILEYDEYFLFPSYIFEEFKKHKEEINEKSRLNKEEFEKIVQVILKKVEIVPNDIINKHKTKALEIAKEIDDLNDTLFIACALAYDGVIWSNDKDFKRQSKIKILNTKEIIGLL